LLNLLGKAAAERDSGKNRIALFGGYSVTDQNAFPRLRARLAALPLLDACTPAGLQAGPGRPHTAEDPQPARTNRADAIAPGGAPVASAAVPAVDHALRGSFLGLHSMAGARGAVRER